MENRPQTNPEYARLTGILDKFHVKKILEDINTSFWRYNMGKVKKIDIETVEADRHPIFLSAYLLQREALTIDKVYMGNPLPWLPPVLHESLRIRNPSLMIGAVSQKKSHVEKTYDYLFIKHDHDENRIADRNMAIRFNHYSDEAPWFRSGMKKEIILGEHDSGQFTQLISDDDASKKLKQALTEFEDFMRRP